jgi:murein biosynthesis integral membrane protein MurJ
MSQPLNTDSQALGSNARMAAIHLRSANKQIFRALLSLASANLLIRIMGLCNQVIVTARFGQGTAMDAYFIAAGLPILLAQLLASSLESSVIPIYARVRSKGSSEQASRLFSTLLNLLIIALVLFTIGMLFLRSPLVILSAPWSPLLTQNIAIELAPYIFPVLIFMTINSFMECLLNTEGQFGWPAYAGILVPLTTATFVIVGGQSRGVVMLCIGTLVGQVLQLLIIILRARRARITYRFSFDLRSPEVIAIALVAWPALFSGLISQASPFVDQIFASSLSVGGIAALNNALKLISVPVGVIFSSVGRAALPYLARQAAMKDMKAFKETFRLYMWAVGIATLTLSAALILLAHTVIQLLFQHGTFTPQDTTRTATTFIGFAIGLAPMAFGFIAAKAFSALGKTRLLMYVTIFSVIANAIFDAIFGRLWQSFGIALATSAVYCCTMIILLITLRSTIGKLYLFTPPREILSVIWKLGMGNYYIQWVDWKEANVNVFRIPYGLSRTITRMFIILGVFAAGTAGSILDGLHTVRVAFGSVIVLYLLRYRYTLLLAWVLLNAFIGSTLPFFNGQNFFTGLTVPSLLLLFILPTRKAFKRMPALALLLIYEFWVFVGITIAPIPLGTFLTLWTIAVDSVAVGVLTICVVTTRRRMLGIIDAILLPSVFIALYGIYGYFIKQHGLVDSTTSFFRISSIFGDTPPTLALFLSTIIPLSFYRTFTLKGLKRIVGVLVTLLLLMTLGLTFTRAALLTVPVSIFLMTLFLPAGKAKSGMLGSMIAIAALVVLAATVGDTPIFSRFFNQDITTLNGRTYLWAAVLGHFDPTQLLGNGLKSSDVLLSNLQVGVGRGVIATASHNIYLETLYESGLIGVTLLIATLLSVIVTLFVKLRKATPDYRMLLAMEIAIFFNVVVQSFESNDFWNPAISIYFWIIMALPFALCWLPAKQVEDEAGDGMEAALSLEREQREEQRSLASV